MGTPPRVYRPSVAPEAVDATVWMGGSVPTLSRRAMLGGCYSAAAWAWEHVDSGDIRRISGDFPVAGMIACLRQKYLA